MSDMREEIRPGIKPGIKPGIIRPGTKPTNGTGNGTGNGRDTINPISMLQSRPGLKSLLEPTVNERSLVNDEKIRRLYLQSSAKQWFIPDKIDFEADVTNDEELKRIWVRVNSVFYTLEKMGLYVIENMMAKAVRKLKSEEIAGYLAAQCFDESRHVLVMENYLRKLGTNPRYHYKYHVLGQVASMGFYRVENWLFSTLFSENFASAFLRRARYAKIDTMGSTICKNILLDESRHIHFLHIVLPDIFDRLSLFGKAYIKASQFFIMKFTEVMSRALEDDVKYVGINRRDLMEEVFENIERSYENFGVTRRFLHFPKLPPA